MKRVKILGALLLTLFLFPKSGSSQIVWEYSWPANNMMKLVYVEGDGLKYIGTDTLAPVIHLYNLDHTVWKNIITGIPATGEYFGTEYYLSRTLFDADQDLELIITYYDVVNNKVVYTTKIINEDGSVLWPGVPGIWFVEVKKVNATDWKMLTHYSADANGHMHTELWSLPGQYISGIAKPQDGDPNSDIYPNPMTVGAKLTYDLPAGQSGTVDIYNMSGMKVRTYNITSQFNDLLIERGQLPAGVYTYTVKSQGMAPVSNKFVIQ